MSNQKKRKWSSDWINRRGTAAAALIPLTNTPGELSAWLACSPYAACVGYAALMLQLARDQNRLEIPGNDHTIAKAFQFSYTE